MTTLHTKFRWLDISALITDFRSGLITESIKFKYLLATYILILLGGSLNIQIPPEPGLIWTVNTFTLLIAVSLGTWYCYALNKAGDNSDFTARYIALGFVVSMRFAVAYFALLVAILLFSPLLQGTSFAETLGVNLWLNVTIMVVTLGLYYYFIAKYIKQIATTDVPVDKDLVA